MTKPKKQSKSISNRKARFDYDIRDTFLVGIELSGAETKAIRQNRISLNGAYVSILNNELCLINATVTGSGAAPIDENDKTRTRKLLAKRKEIDALAEARKQGLTIVPLEILNRSRYIKLRIGSGLGKKNYDKRSIIKTRDENRKIQQYQHKK